MTRPWHHGLVHKLLESGAYIVTAGTHLKQHFLSSRKKLDSFVLSLHQHADEFGWVLQAWAAFSNHYHFVGISPGSAESLPTFLNAFAYGRPLEQE